MIILRLRASAPGSPTFRAILGNARDGKCRPFTEPAFYGKEIERCGLLFDVRALALPRNGRVRVAGDGWNGFDRSPSRNGVDPSVRSKADWAAAARKGFAPLRRGHMADYGRPFDRVALEVGAPTGQSRIPADERIARFGNGCDSSLAALYFQCGRYLTTAGSRPGGQPPNLQGRWNPYVVPPRAGACTTHINTEMNDWPAVVRACHEIA